MKMILQCVIHRMSHLLHHNSSYRQSTSKAIHSISGMEISSDERGPGPTEKPHSSTFIRPLGLVFHIGLFHPRVSPAHSSAWFQIMGQGEVKKERGNRRGMEMVSISAFLEINVTLGVTIILGQLSKHPNIYSFMRLNSLFLRFL